MVGPDLARERHPLLDREVGVGVALLAGGELLQGGGQHADLHELRLEGGDGHGLLQSAVGRTIRPAMETGQTTGHLRVVSSVTLSFGRVRLDRGSAVHRRPAPGRSRRRSSGPAGTSPPGRPAQRHGLVGRAPVHQVQDEVAPVAGGQRVQEATVSRGLDDLCAGTQLLLHLPQHLPGRIAARPVVQVVVPAEHLPVLHGRGPGELQNAHVDRRETESVRPGRELVGPLPELGVPASLGRPDRQARRAAEVVEAGERRVGGVRVPGVEGEDAEVRPRGRALPDRTRVRHAARHVRAVAEQPLRSQSPRGQAGADVGDQGRVLRRKRAPR